MTRARWARWARVGRGPGWPGWLGSPFMAIGAANVLVLVLALAAMLGDSAAPAAEAARPPSRPSCGNAVGPFTVHGTQVLGAGGRAFVSYGTTVSGLQNRDWEASLNLDLQQIAATASDWCANTVRLQFSQDNLLGPTGTGFNQAYMNAIKAEVLTAESDNLVVVLNDSTNSTAPVWMAELGPTPATKTFWKDLTGVYGQDPQVIFDLFNEPRMYYSGMSPALEWKLWLNGGSFLGANYPFGMAELARYVRGTLHAKNLFWIEGPRFSFSFAGMLRQRAALNVSGVVYAVHHPAAPHDSRGWYADFGYLVTQGIGPAVDGEWTNYEPPPTAQATPVATSCWPDAPTAVPAFLKYLAGLGIGLNVYSLLPGYMIKSDANLGDPTTINAGTWSCRSNHERQPGQGAGSLVMAWFKQNNG